MINICMINLISILRAMILLGFSLKNYWRQINHCFHLKIRNSLMNATSGAQTM
jgi:hypothetical protein